MTFDEWMSGVVDKSMNDLSMVERKAVRRVAKSAWNAATQAERKACAHLADCEAASWAYAPDSRKPCENIAAAIRAR